MYEESGRRYRKSLHFETSGETLSVEVSLENIRPETDIPALFSFLETMFLELKEEMGKEQEERRQAWNRNIQSR